MADDKDGALSPEEVKANAILADYDIQIDDIQSQLDAMNHPKPEPRPQPSWMRQTFTPKEETKAAMEKQLETLKKEGKGKVADIAAKSQPGLQGKLYEKAESWRNPNVKTQAQEIKTPEQSMGFVGRLRERGKLAEQQKDFDKTEQAVGKDVAENKQDATQKPSNYYAHLRFNDKDDSQLPGMSKDMDMPEPDKED